ncbi:hypothetical protein PUN28_003641 [Cardiocondyla obscurior]|uniref:Uncharacterized protein n=1 Tax=Cardiocondyla obscurior TaxID=286306 RepID=A0AAW2GNU5_9HYME
MHIEPQKEGEEGEEKGREGGRERKSEREGGGREGRREKGRERKIESRVRERTSRGHGNVFLIRSTLSRITSVKNSTSALARRALDSGRGREKRLAISVATLLPLVSQLSADYRSAPGHFVRGFFPQGEKTRGNL